MITLDDIRGYMAALPEVEEKTHFGQPGFRVRDKLFMTVHLEQGDAIVGVGQAAAAAAAGNAPDVFEEVWRTHGGNRIFVGLRVDLAKVSLDGFRELVELAWRDKAPKRVVIAYDRSM